MTFYRRPFLYLTTFLILGICLAILYPVTVVGYVLVVFALIAGLISIRFKTTIGNYILVGVLPLCLGYSVVSTTTSNSENLENEQTIIVRVDEFSTTQKNWKKSIVTRIEKGRDAGKVLLYFNKEHKIGDVLAVHFDPITIKNKGNPGEFDAENYWLNKGIRTMGFVQNSQCKLIDEDQGSVISKWLSETHSSLSTYLHRQFDDEQAGVLEALLLGDKSNLTKEIRGSFASAGAMHVLAVSGLHVGIIMLILLFVLERLPFRISKRNALIITLILIWCYALFTGMSPSVLRASLMFSILLGGQVLYRQSDSINTLFFSAFLLLLIDPSMLSDIGFQLSYSAVLGILILYRPIADLLYISNKYVRKLWEGTAVGIAAQVFTFPLSLYYFHQFPNYFMITNVGVMVFAGLLLSIGIILIASKGITALNGIVVIVLGLLLNSFLFFIQFIESIPGSVAYGFVLPISMILAIYFVYFIILLESGRRMKTIGIAAFFGLLVWMQFDRYSRMNDSHLMIFNHTQPLIALKTNEAIDVFYSGDRDKSLRIIEDYQKVYPGSIRLRELVDTVGLVVNNQDHSLKITPSGKVIQLDLNNEKIDLLVGYNVPQRENTNTVSLSYLPDLSDTYHLGSGALKIDL